MAAKPDPLEVLALLEGEYPSVPQVALDYEGPLELLVATILSAQCTDARVNIVTKALFRKYRAPEDYADAKLGELEKDIRSTGFYHNKAKNIKATAGMIVKDYEGKVPDTMEDLLKLPGVARKTANIVLTGAYGKVEGIAVDTHVRRFSQRIGLADTDNPERIEQQLMAIYPRSKWARINKLLVAHGRAVCRAKKPMCEDCIITKICPKVGV